MRGLVFEGGGARGAYQIGVTKALIDNGYTFDGFAGTSMGAINAALLASGDINKALEVWSSITFEELFDEEEQPILRFADIKALNADLSLRSKSKRGKAAAKIISNKGICTAKINAFLKPYIDEDRIRKSNKDFGLVTISLSERKPYELLQDDIPKGQLFDYVMASASLPGFRFKSIGEKTFIDGALYNNCPVNLFIDKGGYEEIISIRTNAYGVFRKIEDPRVKYIIPNEDLGGVLRFTPENSETNIKLGYHDGLRFIQKLHGRYYYINPVKEPKLKFKLTSLSDETILKTAQIMGYAEASHSILYKKIIPSLGSFLKLEKNFSLTDFTIAILEYAAQAKNIERFQIYDYDKLCTLTKNAPLTEEKNMPIVRKLKGYMATNKKAAVEFLTDHLI